MNNEKTLPNPSFEDYSKVKIFLDDMVKWVLKVDNLIIKARLIDRKTSSFNKADVDTMIATLSAKVILMLSENYKERLRLFFNHTDEDKDYYIKYYISTVIKSEMYNIILNNIENKDFLADFIAFS